MSKHCLFVYGTLRPGEPNAYLLERIGGTWQSAHIQGHLDPLGWGLTMGYPAIKLDPNGPRIDGFVFSSASLKQNWNRLDEFEGDAYMRVRVTATLRTGESVSAFVYALAQTFT